MEMEIRDIFAALRRRLWLIILTTLAFGAIAAVLSYMVIEPQYKSTTSIIIDKSNEVKNGEVQYNDVIMFEKLIKA